MFPLFDYAYLGIVSGDIDVDAFAVRYFIQEGMEVAVAQSFAKNFGLYGTILACSQSIVSVRWTVIKIE